MNLTNEQREQVRFCILRYCLAPISEGLIRAYLRGDGFSKISDEEVALQLHYLSSKGLVAGTEKKISPENKTWHTTADGMDCLAQNNQEK